MTRDEEKEYVRTMVRTRAKGLNIGGTLLRSAKVLFVVLPILKLTIPNFTLNWAICLMAPIIWYVFVGTIIL